MLPTPSYAPEGHAEHYWLLTPDGEVALPQTLRPAALALTQASPNLVRARGYTQVYDLSDGLPAPASIVLQGTVIGVHGERFRSERELSLYLADLNRAVRAATHIRRDDREPVALQPGGFLHAVPMGRGPSCWAEVSLHLIPAEVPDPDSDSPLFW
ncbi:hypothetical protein RDMS_01525 [Deinococcus sp. RL]|uniref:hypothetical protein n=1 Tax=Deinococcus sp. RL TaxID=1489678 RepID=UPI0004D85794|nr:hypothetical protein [Deinococcus sp. RL]KEF35461.1 hypothetical protein RDMS_01525 [Deinococcus sp. RL]